MTTEAPLPSPVPLDRRHDLSVFECGAPALNDYLRKYAWQNHQSRSARTYVATRDNRVVGYYTLAADHEGEEEAAAPVETAAATA